MSNIKRKSVVVLALLGAIAMGTGAYAYWTGGGSGTGSAATKTTTTAVTAVQTGTLTAMFPGDTAQTLSGKFDNSNGGPVYVTAVTASISTVVKAAGATGACTAADYTLTNPVMTVGRDVASGTAQDSFSGAQIQFKNTGANQDGCKGATVNLAYTIS